MISEYVVSWTMIIILTYSFFLSILRAFIADEKATIMLALFIIIIINIIIIIIIIISTTTIVIIS